MTELALPYLFEQVVDRFELDGLAVDQAFGWRESARKLTGRRRIIWIPGDANGALGAISGAKQPNRTARSLATLDELCTVEIHAADPTQPTDEILQYTATRLLFDEWYRAVYLAVRGAFSVESASWMRSSTEIAYGRCIRVVFSVSAVVPDTARTRAPINASAEIDVELLDVNEPDTVTKEQP